MAKFLKIGSTGLATEEAAAATSAGAGDAGKIVELNGAGKLDITLFPAGIGTDSLSIASGENLAAGDYVYIDSAGDLMKADANAVAKAAVGFVLAGVTAPAAATVYFEGTNTALSGLTPGTRYFLSATTPGGVSAIVPTGSGDIVQSLGIAISATALPFEASDPMVRI